jgi:hypothetical protein
MASKAQQERLHLAQPRSLKRIIDLPNITPNVALEWQINITPVKDRHERRASLLIERGLRLPNQHILRRSLNALQSDENQGTHRLKRPRLIQKVTEITESTLPQLRTREREPLKQHQDTP